MKGLMYESNTGRFRELLQSDQRLGWHMDWFPAAQTCAGRYYARSNGRRVIFVLRACHRDLCGTRRLSCFLARPIGGVWLNRRRRGLCYFAVDVRALLESSSVQTAAQQAR